MTTENEQQLRTGMIMGACAALIWGGWPVVTSLAVKDNISPYQVVLLRTFVSFPLLLPFLFRGKNTVKIWAQTILLTLLAGAPYSLLVSSSFQYASATHGGVIIPGTVMLIGLITSHFILKDKISKNRFLGGGAIIIGLILLASGGTGEGGSSLYGDLLFFLGGISWGLYTLFLRLWPADPIILTARIAFVSTIFMGFYSLYTTQIGLSALPTDAIIFHGIWQGVLSGTLAVIFFNKGVALMGAAKATVVNSLVPVISTALAFFILNEIPNLLERFGLAFIMGGIVMALYTKRTSTKAPNTS